MTVLVVACILFLTAPVAYALGLAIEHRREAYPTDGDSIAIPIALFLMALSATAPITWGFVWLCARRYPGRVALTLWNRQRPVWSSGWTLFVVVSLVPFVDAAIGWAAAPIVWPTLLHVVADIWFLLVLRAAIVAQVKPADGRLQAAPANVGATLR